MTVRSIATASVVAVISVIGTISVLPFASCFTATTTVRSLALSNNHKSFFSTKATGSDETELQSSLTSASSRIEDCKRTLINQCNSHKLESGYSSSIDSSIRNLEQLGEDLGFGQASSVSGLLSGEWELIYASDDITRSLGSSLTAWNLYNAWREPSFSL